MAQWRHADRTLCAKVVYRGPALGGTTTNLRSLHRITDPEGVGTLLSVNTVAAFLANHVGEPAAREGGGSEFHLVVPMEIVHA